MYMIININNYTWIIWYNFVKKRKLLLIIIQIIDFEL